MITVLTGDNSFEIRQRLLGIKKDAVGNIETIEGENVTARDLPSLLFGVSLFDQSRTIVLKRLSESAEAWIKLADYVEKADEQNEIILVEPAMDKRTKTYKALKKHAKIETFEAWTYRDEGRAVNWVIKESESLDMKSSRTEAKYLVDRVGLDQWRLKNSIDKLALLGSMSKGIVDTIVEEDIHENVFQLLETALSGNVSAVVDMTNNLERTEESYKVFGLLSGQLFQLVALANAPSVKDVVKDLKMHPYAADQQAKLTKKVSSSKLSKSVKLFAECDEAVRFSRQDLVWAELTKLLVQICKI